MDYLIKDFGKLLKKNHLGNRHLLGPDTDCMRVYDRNQEQFPVTVDLYGRYARITDYSDEGLPAHVLGHLADSCASNLYLDKSNIVCARRARRPEGAQHEKSGAEAVVTSVKEDGLLFEVDLTTYADTGLFLDHALARRFIREQSAGKNVLNLFSYTGSFSVYAAAGGADSVTSVDLSATYTAWARRNLENNGFSGDNYCCICTDALTFVKEAAQSSRRYSIIIFDPPAFSNSRKTDYDFDVKRDWKDWIDLLERILTKDGFILFSTNLSGFKMERGVTDLRKSEMTYYFRAPGFKKGTKGSVRSWIMAKEENTLSLNWEEDRKPKKEHGRKEYGRNEYGRNEYGRNEYKPRSRRPERPEYGDRPQRREHRDYEDRYPRREHRDYEDRYPRRERPDYADRPRRNYDADRPRYTSDRPARPRREYRDSEDRYPRRERQDYSDRPRREYGSDRPSRPARSERTEKPVRTKPYGYDSFRPARSRGDNSRFFWNEDED